MARNERRMRRGEEPLDVESEVDRQLRNSARERAPQSGIQASWPTTAAIEIEELLVRPGTYFNPQTEVLVVVDDSSSMDTEIFNLEEFEGADWVLVSDESPVDEAQRDELLETFQATYHGGDGRQTRAMADPDAVDDEVDARPDDDRTRIAAAPSAEDDDAELTHRLPAVRPVHYLGIFIPIAVGLELAHASPVLIFGAAALGVIPTAAVMGEATEHLAAQTGPGHRRLPQRDLRQRAGADHRLLRAQGGAPGGRQGLDRRLDHRQHPARAGRGDARRRPQARQAGVQPDGRPRAVGDAAAGAHAR